MTPRALPRRLLLPLVAVGATALVVLVVPVPGSLSVVATRSLAGLGADFAHIDLVSEVGLATLALATAGAIVLSWLRHPERRLTTSVAALGVVVAYAASEAAKLLFAQARPCSRWAIAGDCPPAGDWSLPSNHATLAFGALVVIAFAAGRAWIVWTGAALATLVAAGRVAQGVHYLHDVALGAVFGLALPTALVAIVVTSMQRVKRRTSR
ncbi:phosphatase PAP2 family protein [Microbacterium sp. NPDC087591]|uniref:phosphatase PAP2 family protein n=1 Tax=Microbacterium sp. NPDC087591 TaxID=3364192 RepID=UPI003807EB19